MSAIRTFIDADAASRAWINAGRPGDFNRFAREFIAREKAALAEAPRVELWIRRKGTRRFADWRVAGSNSSWSWVEITKADRAAREGRITVGSFIDALVVIHEEAVTS